MASLGGKRRLRNRVLGGAAGVLVFLGASSGVFLTSDAGAGVLLKILSPAGSGYDAASGDVTTSKGGAVTLTRASTWTCQDSSGAIRSLAADKPCVVDGASLRVRGAVTNRLLHSKELDNAVSDDSPDLTVTVAANDAVGPDGTQSAEKATWSATGDWQQIIPGAFESQTHTVCGWVKSASAANESFALKLTHANVIDNYSATLTATQQWQRFSFSRAFGATVGTGAIGGVRAAAGVSLHITDMQVAINSSQCGDTCPTGAAAATCAAETATTELSPAPAAAPWCVRATLRRSTGDAAWNAGIARMVWANDATGNGDVRWYTTGSGILTMQVFDAALGLKEWASTTAVLSTQTSAKVRACYDGSAAAFWVDDASVAITASGAGTGALPGLATTHWLGVMFDSTYHLSANLDGFCFDDSLSGCQ